MSGGDMQMVNMRHIAMAFLIAVLKFKHFCGGIDLGGSKLEFSADVFFAITSNW